MAVDYSNILNNYLKQVSLDEQRAREEIVETPLDFDDEIEALVLGGTDPEAVAEMVNKMKSDPNDPANYYAREYKQMTDNELSEAGLLKEQVVPARVVRAYCPKCGEELVCYHNPYKNPHNGEVIARHNCKCGFKVGLEHAFPYIVVREDDEFIEIPIQA